MSDLDRDFNNSRYRTGTTEGFYESYFLRANHPTKPQAFWIRYTIFCPRGHSGDALGELWAIWFDGETGQHVVAKTEVPAGHFSFRNDGLHVRVGNATLEPGLLKGGASGRGHHVEWNLTYTGDAKPLFLLAPELYAGAFPKAKSLVGLPMARFRGALVVDGRGIPIEDWLGSQNHNWGTRHTDRYAWGQVAGFDNAAESFLEVATGQIKFGPLWSPRLTPLVLRHRGEEFALNTITQMLARSSGHFGFFHWNFRARATGIEIEGTIRAPKESFVGLRYYNPPGGEKWCLNSKIASCHLVVRREGKPDETLEARHRAAFELLTDHAAHGVEIRT